MEWNQTITSCSFMFSNLEIITSIDLSKFDVSKVINMNGMFFNCKKLKYINFRLTSIDLSSFITSSVTDMSYLF